MPDYANYIEIARTAVAQACSVCRQVQGALDEVRSITKDDRSPVTVADFASQAIIGRRLREALGDNVVLVAEETSHFLRERDHDAHLDAVVAAVREVWDDASADDVLDWIDVGAGDTHHSGFWTLDPIDGTKGFLRGQQYAVALAYVENGEPTVGALGCPNLSLDFSAPFDERDAGGCLYFAVRGEGLFEVPANEPGAEPVHIRRLDHEEGEAISVCMSVEKAHSSTSDTDRVLERVAAGGIPTGEPARLDSQAKYAVVGRGQADAYLRLPAKKGYVERIWDHAAGSLIATEGGSFVTDIHGRALDFSHGRGLEKNIGIVCAPPRVHGALIEAIDVLGIEAE
jgi:HAL2 family 3'(2'),5'-bisphosphate nucleotidase